VSKSDVLARIAAERARSGGHGLPTDRRANAETLAAHEIALVPPAAHHA